MRTEKLPVSTGKKILFGLVEMIITASFCFWLQALVSNEVFMQINIAAL